MQGITTENYINQETTHFVVLCYFKDYGNWGYVKQGPPVIWVFLLLRYKVNHWWGGLSGTHSFTSVHLGPIPLYSETRQREKLKMHI